VVFKFDSEMVRTTVSYSSQSTAGLAVN